MLYYGNGNYIPDDCKVFNLNSMIEGYPRLGLLPPNFLGQYVDRDFDIAYYNYLFSNDMIFAEFFSLVYELYIGNDVFILVDQTMDWTENLTESLFKAIQQRYGYNSVQVNSFDDYVWVKNSSSPPQFNPDYGLHNLDVDRERYTYIVESSRLRAGGDLVYVE